MIRITLKVSIGLALLFTGIAKAQDFQGQAYYVSKTNMSGAMKIDSPGVSDEMKKMMEERIKKAFEKNYILTFNKTESVYEEEEKLDAPSPGSNGMFVKMSSSAGGKMYKNIKSKKTVSEQEFFDKEFLVTDSLKALNWKLEDESKKIGEYTCYKATFTVTVTKEQIESYENLKKKPSNSKTSFLIVDEPKDKVITVWYTPEIPVSHGPDKYWGLPGLILEASFDKTTLLCSKVIVNPKDKIEIKVPKKGKKVTNSEYETLVEKHLEEMKDPDGNIKIEINR